MRAAYHNIKERTYKTKGNNDAAEIKELVTERLEREGGSISLESDSVCSF